MAKHEKENFTNICLYVCINERLECKTKSFRAGRERLRFKETFYSGEDRNQMFKVEPDR